MKKIYNCPATEVIVVSSTYGVCQAVSYTEGFNGTPIEGDPGDGR